MRSLRTRLLAAYAGLILLGFSALALLAGRAIFAGTVQDYTRGLTEQAELVARVLKEDLEEEFEHPAGDRGPVSEVLRTYSEQLNAELTLVDHEGRFLASGSGQLVPTNTPVILAAQRGTLSSETRDGHAYAAAPIFDEGRVAGVVQLAAPLSAAQSLVWRRWLALAGAVLVVTAVAGAAALVLSTTLTRPLEQLRRAALLIAQGDFSQRVPDSRQDEIGQVARAFNHMAAQVEEMVEEQRAFASNASHELRTPLTAIRLRSEALRDGDLDTATARRYVVEMDDEVQRVGNLVQDLMVLSRLDSGRMETGHERIDMARLARQLLAEVEPAAANRGIALEFEAPSTLPPVTATIAHLQIVFRNLLSNALKYTGDGGRIHWQIALTQDSFHHTISDNGQGIAAEDLPHVFDRFYRADKSRSRAVPGVGLGLSLVRMIVEFYGGTVRVDSAGVGHGTQARVTWPQ